MLACLQRNLKGLKRVKGILEPHVSVRKGPALPCPKKHAERTLGAACKTEWPGHDVLTPGPPISSVAFWHCGSMMCNAAGAVSTPEPTPNT